MSVSVRNKHYAYRYHNDPRQVVKVAVAHEDNTRNIADGILLNNDIIKEFAMVNL